MARPSRRFSIYDAMEARGDFESNPANIDSRDSQGRSMYKKAEYPRMLYHPAGEEKITVAGTAIATPFGPQMVGEQRELISRIVENPREEKKLLDEGWHRLPAQAVAARTGQPIPMDAKETEIDALKRKLIEAEARAAELELALAKEDNFVPSKHGSKPSSGASTK